MIKKYSFCMVVIICCMVPEQIQTLQTRPETVPVFIKQKASPFEIEWHNLDNLYDFLEKGANINAQNTTGSTVLTKVIEWGYSSMVDALIASGADLNLQDIYGRTPLMHAALKGNKYIILALLNAGADPYMESFDESTIRSHVSQQRIQGISDRTIVSNAKKNFDSIFRREHPELLKNSEIQKALAEYDRRFIKHKKDVAKQVEIHASSEQKHFIPVLADIVADYAVDEITSVKKEVEGKKSNASGCIIM